METNIALKLNVYSATTRRLLTSEPVTASDIAALRAEAWLHCCLREGLAGLPLADAHLDVVPILKADSDTICAGFALESKGPAGQRVRREFGARSLVDTARRALERLVQFGVLGETDQYHLELVRDSEPHAPEAANIGDNPGNVSVNSSPLHFLSVPLRPLLKQSKTIDELDEDAFHVFYTDRALAASEQFSRKGAAALPVVETGAALAGFLCLAADTTDCFLVVTDVLEAVNSEGTEFSLTYTSQSWTRISRIMAARQKAQPAWRLCGSAHGHNFSAGTPCAACFKTSAPCGQHNVLPSTSDNLWTRSVFAHQPWALCHIFGANARGDALSGLFTFHWGSLTRRGFSVLPDFKPEQWETICATNLNRSPIHA